MAMIVLHLKFTEKNNNNKIFFFFFGQQFRGIPGKILIDWPWVLYPTLETDEDTSLILHKYYGRMTG